MPVAEDPRPDIRNNALEAHPSDPGDLLLLRDLLRNPWKIFFYNILAGVGRGLGFALGFTVLAAAVMVVAIALLRSAISLPVVGHHIAEFITSVQNQVEQMSRVKPTP